MRRFLFLALILAATNAWALDYNTAGGVYVFIYDKTTGAGITGESKTTFSIYESIDGSTPATAVASVAAGKVVEVDSTNQKGWYYVPLAAGEMKGTCLGITVTSVTANALSEPIIIYPTPLYMSKFAIDASGRVDIGSTLGTASKGAAGYMGIDWAQIANPTSTVDFTKTTVGVITSYTGNTPQTADSNTILSALNTLTKAGGGGDLAALWTRVSLALPAKAPDAAGGLPVSDAGGLDLDAIGTNAALLSNGTYGLAKLLQKSDYTAPTNLTAAQIATGVWQDKTAGDFSVGDSIGETLYIKAKIPGAAGGLAIVGSNMGTVSSVTTLPAFLLKADYTVLGDTAGTTTLLNLTKAGGAGDLAAMWTRIGLALPAKAPNVAGGLTILGSQVDLVDAPNAKAVTAIQKGLSTFDYTTNKVIGSLVDKVTTTDSIAATGLDLILKTATFSQAIAAATWEYNIAAIVGANLAGTQLNLAAAGGGGLTAQQVRNAMLLAPVGAAAVGSIDALIGALPTAVQNAAANWGALTGGWGAGSMGLLITTNLNATVGSRATVADVRIVIP